MDIRHVLAANLRRIRHEKGFSQEELAFHAGINRTYASKLETASTWAGLEVISKIAKVLEVEPAELLLELRPSDRRKKKVPRT